MGAVDDAVSNEICDFLVNKFNVSIFPEPNIYLGIDVEWRRSSHQVFLSQTSYIDKLAAKFKIDDRYLSKLPMAKNTRLLKRTPDQETCQQPYKEIVGSLIYISTCTRPDISFAVSKLTQFFSDPSDEHFKAAIKVVSYLVLTRELGLSLGGRMDTELTVYVDADFAEDSDTRHSITGNLIYFSGSLISWTSKKQKLIATSSTEAEFLAVFYTLRDVQYIEQILTSIFSNQQFLIKHFQLP